MKTQLAFFGILALVLPVSADEEHERAEVDPAVAFFQARVDQFPDDLAAWSRLGSLHLSEARASGDHGSFLSAREAFLRVIDMQSTSIGAHLGVVRAELGRHGFDAALMHAREAAVLAPDEPRTWAALGDVHFALGNYVEAEALYKRMLAASIDLESLARMGTIHELRGRTHKAHMAYTNALRAGELQNASPGDRAWCEAMLGDLARRLEDPETAEGHYRAALALDPAEKLAVHGLANLLITREEYDEALGLLRRLVLVAPEIRQLMALGDLLVLVGDVEEGQRWLTHAEDHMVEDVERGEYGHLRDLAEYWLEHDGDPKRAAAMMRLDLELRSDLDSLVVAARAFEAAGASDEALAAAQRASVWGRPDVARLLEGVTANQ